MREEVHRDPEVEKMARTLKELTEVAEALYENYLYEDSVPKADVDEIKTLVESLPTHE